MVHESCLINLLHLNRKNEERREEEKAGSSRDKERKRRVEGTEQYSGLEFFTL